MGLTLNYTTSDFNTAQKKICLIIQTGNKRCMQQQNGDENCLQAALQEGITEEASVSCGNEWQVRAQPPVHAQIAKHRVVNMHKCSELDRWSDRSALLCANAPEISAHCISQTSVLGFSFFFFFAKLVSLLSARTNENKWVNEWVMAPQNLYVLF